MNDALPRVYLSSASLKVLQRTGLVLLFIAAPVTSFLAAEPYAVIANDWFAFFAIGAGLVMTLIGLVARSPESSCAMCRRPRAQVRKLVASPAVSVCDACIALAAQVIAEGLLHEGDAAGWLNQVLESLPPHCPTALSTPALERLAELDGTASALRRLASSALRLGNPQQAVTLLERVAENERQASDWLNLSRALELSGKNELALAATNRVTEAAAEWPLAVNNSVWFRARIAPERIAEESGALLRKLEAARDVVRARPQAEWQRLLSYFYGTAAEVRRIAGDLEACLRDLDEADRLGGVDGERMLTRGYRLIALGRSNDARAVFEQALRELHPESLAAREAREQLARNG